MPVVAQGTQWWIETFHVARASIADQAERVNAHTLERPGVYLGGSATMSYDLSASLVGGLAITMRNTDNSALVRGQNISAFESVISNDTGASASVGNIVFIILRKSG